MGRKTRKRRNRRKRRQERMTLVSGGKFKVGHKSLSGRTGKVHQVKMKSLANAKERRNEDIGSN